MGQLARLVVLSCGMGRPGRGCLMQSKQPWEVSQEREEARSP